MDRITAFIVRHFKPIAALGIMWIVALIIHNLTAWELPLKTHIRNYIILLLISGFFFFLRARFGTFTDFRVGSGRHTRGIKAPFPVYFAVVLVMAIYISAAAFTMTAPVEPFAAAAVFFGIISIPE